MAGAGGYSSVQRSQSMRSAAWRAEAVGDVLVAEEHGWLDPAEGVHDGAGLDSGLEQEGGGAVAGVMDPVGPQPAQMSSTY